MKVLLVLIGLGLAFPPVLRLMMPERQVISGQARMEIARFMEGLDKNRGPAAEGRTNASRMDASRTDAGKAVGDRLPEPVVYFDFDPNTLDAGGWSRLGFSPQQIRMIGNYLEKGGHFYRKEDLQKIYAVTEMDFERVKDYIRIDGDRTGGRPARSGSEPSNSTSSRQEPHAPRSQTQKWKGGRTFPVIEINGADSLQLQLLPGIGPAFASRIVRFRERLGGFFEAEQLLEIYGMDSTRFEGLMAYVRVDTALVRRIRINEADTETLGRHPLIGYKLGNLIIRFRDHHGAFGNEADLKKLGVLDEGTIRKIARYLEF